jgi:hypothetical protein
VTHLLGFERLDHALRGHAANPFVALDAHWGESAE